MQGKKIKDGESATYTTTPAVTAGDIVVQGSMPGIATEGIAALGTGKLDLDGVFDVVKGPDAFIIGAPVFWNATGSPLGGVAGTGCATATRGANVFLGWATVAALADDTVVRVKKKLVPSTSVTHYGPINNAIADPGDAGAIPVTGSGYVPLVSAGGETRTLAVPTYIGQELLLYCKTYVGAIAITCAQAINETGNTIMTYSAAGEYISLVGVEEGATMRWRPVGNDGVALS